MNDGEHRSGWRSRVQAEMLRAMTSRQRSIRSGLAIVAAVVAVAGAGDAAGAAPAAGAVPATRAAPDAAARAASARLDRSFGGGRGWVTTRIRGRSALAYAATIARAGRIVIAGQATTSQGEGQIVVARYLPGGRLDSTFGNRGVFTTAFPAKTGPYSGLAVRAQGTGGKLVIAGGYGLGSMLIIRLTARGRLDHSFGTRRSGYTTVSIGGTGESLAIGRRGAIYVGGSNANANGRPMVVARLTSAGRLDSSFGRRGIAQVAFWNLRLAASAGTTGLAVTGDGGVIGSGHLDYIGSDGHGSAGIFRLNPRGRPLKGFGQSGHLEVAFTRPGGAFQQWFPCAMTVDGRGRITVTGDGSAGSGAALLTIRTSARGVLDRGFGSTRNGRAILPGLEGDNTTTCGATVSRSGVLTAGVSRTLARLRSNGSPDRGFSSTGRLRIGRPAAVAIQAVVASGSGAVLVAGSAGNNIYVARYLLGRGPR
jgi:uncharacterized delta-60 repeat protein